MSYDVTKWDSAKNHKLRELDKEATEVAEYILQSKDTPAIARQRFYAEKKEKEKPPILSMRRIKMNEKLAAESMMD